VNFSVSGGDLNYQFFLKWLSWRYILIGAGVLFDLYYCLLPERKKPSATEELLISQHSPLYLKSELYQVPSPFARDFWGEMRNFHRNRLKAW